MDSTLGDSSGKVAAPARLWRRSRSGALLAVGLPQQGPATLTELPVNAALAEGSCTATAGPDLCPILQHLIAQRHVQDGGNRPQLSAAPPSEPEASEWLSGATESVRNAA